MEDYRKKKMTKAQMWDKMHEERRMWQERCEYIRQQAVEETTVKIRTLTDQIISSIVKSCGMQNGDVWMLAFKLLEPKDGYVWTCKFKTIAEEHQHDFVVQVEEVKVPEPEEEIQQEEEEQ